MPKALQNIVKNYNAARSPASTEDTSAKPNAMKQVSGKKKPAKSLEFSDSEGYKLNTIDRRAKKDEE